MSGSAKARTTAERHGPKEVAAVIEEAASHVLYEHAKRYGWWPEDRINPISKVRQGGQRQSTPIRLNLEELHQLIYEVLKQRERTMVLFDFAGGLRRGELTGSKWGDIDFVQRYSRRSARP
jgi:integrase